MATKKKEVKETPLMKQYNEIKGQYPNTILLFRVGDFYETFGEDAVEAAGILGIILTKRANGSAAYIELAGFPHHSLETYLPKLVRAGKRVAICDQLEDPKMTKTIVKRGVTEVVTPGVALSDSVLEKKHNNFLAAIHFEKDCVGVSFVDISTGDFKVCSGSPELIKKIIFSYNPTEVLYKKSDYDKIINLIGERFYFYGLDDWVLETNHSIDLIKEVFEVKSFKGYGFDNANDVSLYAAGMCIHYLKQNQVANLSHLDGIQRLAHNDFVWMDDFTIKNLELIFPLNKEGKSLLDVIDSTQTPMGGRMLREWIAFPLNDLISIHSRNDKVSFLVEHKDLTHLISAQLINIKDLSRLSSKLVLNKLNPKELAVLRESLVHTTNIDGIIQEENAYELASLTSEFGALKKVIEVINESLLDEPAIAVGKGDIIKPGVHKELDELKSIVRDGKNILLRMQQDESEKTGIPSLKIAFNNVFGYYLEVRNTHKDKVPETWIRKQTLTQAERYITPELKEYESKILTAEDKIHVLESNLYNELVSKVALYVKQINNASFKIASLDCLISFSQLAIDLNWSKPVVDDSHVIDIKEGRHPVIENALPKGQPFIANDLMLNDQEQQIIMVTGPNMSGKSAILRQTALIAILAQMGSFVPAKEARIGVLDKIFTRVGASDNLAAGESTFMVEMTETASILNNLSSRSLVLLDEIGRGTSTYDGVSIAKAIAEYLAENENKPRTLFATHYHELNQLEESFDGIKNFNVSVKEVNGKVHFLRKLVKGGSAHSFGIHVAKMAGVPKKVVSRAEKILDELEESPTSKNKPVVKSKKKKSDDAAYQLSFIQLDDPILEEIRDEIKDLDINSLTPMEALNRLNEIKNMIG